MTLIETKVLGTAAASIEFTSIPQDGTDLLALISVRGSVADIANLLNIYPNGSTSSLSGRFLRGNGTGATSEALVRFYLQGNTATSNTFGNGSVYFPNYAGSTNKSFSIDAVTENNGTEAYQNISAGLWSNTAAITSLTFTANADNLVIGSTISLYKITKGSDGIVTTS